MTKTCLFGLALCCAAGLVACGSNDTGPSFNGTISDSAAASLGGSAADFVDDMLSTYRQGSPNIEIPLSPATPVGGLALLNRAYQLAGIHRAFTIKGRPAGSPPVMRVADGGCDEVATGDTLDDDEDGIPNNLTATVNCTTIDSIEHDTITSHIIVHVADVIGLYGFNVSVTADQREGSPEGSEHILLTESEGFLVTSSIDHDNVTVDANDTVTPTGGAASGGQVHYDWNSNFTPAEGQVLAAASPPDGFLAFSGGFFVTSLQTPSTNFSFGLSTTTPLVYDAECGSTPPFTDGTVIGHLNGANSEVGFTVNYTGCGDDPTVTGHGNATS